MQKHHKGRKGSTVQRILGNVMVAKEVKAMVEKQNPNNTDKQRQLLVYFMRHEDQRHRVGKEMFLNTLDLKEWTVWNWVLSKKGDNQFHPHTSSHLDPAALQKANCSKFLDNVLTLPSHYCRKSSSNKYVERGLKSINEVVRPYTNSCKENGETPLAQQAFSKLFHEKKTCPYSHHRKISATSASSSSNETCQRKAGKSMAQERPKLKVRNPRTRS